MLTLLLWLGLTIAAPLYVARVVGRMSDHYPTVPREAPVHRRAA